MRLHYPFGLRQLDLRRISPNDWELRWFGNLRPRLQHWTEISRQADGNAEFHDPIMATHLRLNSTALAIVERMQTGQQTLNEIAAELSRLYGLSERQMLVDVARVYKRLESCDATVHPWWRYGALYFQHLRHVFNTGRSVFFAAFVRGIGWW